MRTIARGFYDQYMFRRPIQWPMIPSHTFRHSVKRMKTIGDSQYAPPRWAMLVGALEIRGLLNVWIYRRHLESVLRPIGITSKDAFETVWRERSQLGQVGMLFHKGGVPRFIGEYVGKPLTWDQGVLELDSGATKAEAQEFFALLQFGFGAYGGTLSQYPIPGLSHRYAIVDVKDFSGLQKFIRDSNDVRRKVRDAQMNSPTWRAGHRPPSFDARLHVDPSPGRVLPYDGVDKILAEPLPSEVRSSTLSVRDAKVDELQKKLNDLAAMLAAK